MLAANDAPFKVRVTVYSDFVCPFLTLRPLLGADPLRPELAESTYALYRATRDPYYLRQGETMLQSLNGAPRVPGGFASVKDVKNPRLLEDRMASFFLDDDDALPASIRLVPRAEISSSGTGAASF